MFRDNVRGHYNVAADFYLNIDVKEAQSRNSVPVMITMAEKQ